MFVFFTLLQLAVAAVLAYVRFEACDAMYDLTAVQIDGCDERIPCYVTIGQNVSITLYFHADYLYQNLDQDAWMDINDVVSPAEVSPEKCQTNYNCSAVSTMDTITSLTGVVTVPDDIPTSVRGFMHWLTESEGQPLLCFSVRVATQRIEQKRLRDLFNLYKYDTEEVPSSDNEKLVNP
ncbi:unnamed protein product [Spodoptera littoralis]|uniref:MD-2-related lipid-recognition domain-containing protein n=1 Tax=Spodoptera littoralis TaxID=7109 RepID=A0A9P0I2E9_SPOLI|nr:unnamed protein product [Spodoptera littoralis]CAH1637770.1 unnamed protein product [Spodoptera littoralis]